MPVSKRENPREIRAAIDWYDQVVRFLLNRAENMPPAIRELIRQGSHERRAKYGYPESEDKST